MSNKFKTVFNWSGGKDSSIALHRILKNPDYSIDRLLTSVNRAHGRVSMHGVRQELLERQAQHIGIALSILNLPEQPGMEEYNRLSGEMMSALKEEGFTHSVFGDIFLEDLRTYRENRLRKLGYETVFPIWKHDTRELIEQFIEDGFQAVIVCVKADVLDQSFAGRPVDRNFLKELPDNVDPCGENGEFHTFVYDGPIFSSPVPFKKGEVVYRSYKAPAENNDVCSSGDEKDPGKMGFWFCDLTA